MTTVLTTEERGIVDQIIAAVPENVREDAQRANNAHRCYYESLLERYPDLLRGLEGALHESPRLTAEERRMIRDLSGAADRAQAEVNRLTEAEAIRLGVHQRRVESDPRFFLHDVASSEIAPWQNCRIGSLDQPRFAERRPGHLSHAPIFRA